MFYSKRLLIFMLTLDNVYAWYRKIINMCIPLVLNLNLPVLCEGSGMSKLNHVPQCPGLNGNNLLSGAHGTTVIKLIELLSTVYNNKTFTFVL